MGKSCFFIGHRNTPGEIEVLLSQEVKRHIEEEGVTNFYVGNRGNFDRMAAGEVIRAKQEYGNIALYLVINNHPALCPVTLPEGFDGTYYPFTKSFLYAYSMSEASADMIDRCDYLIAYARHIGNARRLFSYARMIAKLGLINVVNLADHTKNTLERR